MAAKYCPTCKKTYPAAERLCPDDGSVLSLHDPYHLVGKSLLDKYRIEALVGLGGMGAVYCAHHQGIDRRVAFKILQPNIAVNDEHMAELFEREAKVAGRLSHENIVDVKDAGRSSDGLAYIVMEWLEGRTLEEELKATGRLSFARAGEILRQIAAALEEAHSKHVVHRDLKPANVMLVVRTDGREQVKVLDFGIGKVVGETGSSVSAVMGTPSYSSPEQLQLGGQIDSRSDIYSLGVILYRILSGRLPFQAASVSELIQMQLTAAPAPLRELRPETPAEVEQLVSRMLAKDPAERPQSPREVAVAFDQALAEAVTSDFETRLLVESPPSGETTIERARKMIQQTTESMSEAEPPPKDAPTTRPFTGHLAAQRINRARSRLVYVSLAGLALIAAGYGLSRYVFNDERRATEPGAAQVIQNAPTQTPAPAPTAVSAPTGAVAAVSPEKLPVAAPEAAQTPSIASRRLADQHFSQARELYLKNDYRAALSKTNEALKLNPRHRGALALRRKIQETIKILEGR